MSQQPPSWQPVLPPQPPPSWQQPQYPPQQQWQQPYPPQQQWLPPYPPPPRTPNPKLPRKKRTGLWIILGIIGVLVFAGIGASLLAGKNAQPTSATTNNAQAPTTSSVPTQAATQVSTKVPGNTATQAPTNVPGNTATYGRPHISGPISDFYGKYGKPTNQGKGKSETWTIGVSPTALLISATPDAGRNVMQVSVVGEHSWSRVYTEQYCSRFLPSDASEFNLFKTSSQTLIDYHSSEGEILMAVADQGSCELTIAFV